MDAQAALTLAMIYATALFLVGLAMGSFLNVVAFRSPNNISILRPPSTCPVCDTPISPYDNIPVIGYLRLKGRCRSCGVAIPVRYLLVELVTGVLWAITGWKIAALQLGMVQNVAVGVVWLAFVSSAVITFLTDYDYLIILDEISLGGTFLAILVSPFIPFLHHAHTGGAFMRFHSIIAYFLPGFAPWQYSLIASLLGAAVGLGFSLLIYTLANAAFKRQIAHAQADDPDIDTALGLGDVKLMGFYGAFLGWFSVLFIYLVGSALGTFVGIVTKLATGDPAGETGLAGWRNRWRSSSSVLPFGPFLVVAALVYFFVGDRVFIWLNF